MTVDKSLFLNKLSNTLAANGMEELFSERTAELLQALTVRMLEVNEYMNLTAITDIDGVIVKHYADSLYASRYIPEGASVIDVGCGAGFPSLPLAIARPDIRVTALDSTSKRIAYIKETAEMLGISNISCIAARAEELAHDRDHREKYDISCARAVARLNVLCELCIPYVKKNGKFIAMKANFAEELNEASAAIKKLGGRLSASHTFDLAFPETQVRDPRSVIEIEKISETPEKYPRNNSQIKKKPM